MSIFTRLFHRRRTFTLRESRLYVNGREATPEEAAEALAIVDERWRMRRSGAISAARKERSDG